MAQRFRYSRASASARTPRTLVSSATSVSPSRVGSSSRMPIRPTLTAFPPPQGASHLLLVDPARVGPPHVAQLSDGPPGQALVLAHQHAALPPGHAEDEAQGAEVAVLDPQVQRLDGLEYVGKQGAFLGV